MAEAAPKEDVPAPQAVHHEWRTAENSADYLLPTLQVMKEKNPSLRILDVGAGSGTISLTLAQIVPSGKVTATDINPDILPRAAAVAKTAGVENIEFLQADVLSLPFEDGTFDVTHCHQMLCHLKKPWDALREMMRVTKVGGVIAAREGDVQTECFWPELEGLVKYHGLAVKLMDSAGSSRAGRQLLSWALKAGAERDQITPTYGTWFYNQPADKKPWGEFSSFHFGGMH